MSNDTVGRDRRRVVIIGGGFGGMAAARHLKDAAVDVTVIDRKNHHLFQPLIYQVAGGGLSSGQVAAPIRQMLDRQPNATVLMGEVTDIDLEARQVILDRGDRLGYDSLIVACGSETSYFGQPELEEHSCALKTLEDAVDLRNRIFGAFEEAERTSPRGRREDWLTFVVVGGGPTGVEISGQLAILTRHSLKRGFRRIDTRAARVVLVDAEDRLVPAFSASTSATAARGLSQLGVEVREGAVATAIDPRSVTIKVGSQTERIATRTVVWAAGVRTAPIAKILARAAGVATDRAGRIEVNPNLTLPGRPEISVIGDAAKLAGRDGQPLPGLATVAIQEARHVAKGVNRGGTGASKPFRYFDKGALAVIGRGRAVGEIRGHRIDGLFAFLMYLGIHLYYLGGVGGRRLTVLATWIAAGFGVRQNRVIQGELGSLERPLAAPPARESRPRVRAS